MLKLQVDASTGITKKILRLKKRSHCRKQIALSALTCRLSPFA